MVLPYINMYPPQVYTCSTSWTPLPPPSPYHPSYLLFQWSIGCWQFGLWLSAFSKTSLNIWKFTVHILLKPGLENFEHYFTSVFSSVQFSSVQSFSHAQLFATPWMAARQASLFTQLPEFTQLMSIELVMPSSHLILCCPCLFLPPISPSIRVFPMSQLFTWGGQSTGVSALASVLQMNT